MPDTTTRPPIDGFQFEHPLPDGTIVLTDSPEGIGAFVYTPHLAGKNPRYTEVLTVDELKAIMPDAFTPKATPAAAADADATVDATTADDEGDNF